MEPAVFPCTPLRGHELLDSGAGRKLERFGALVIDRPDPQALWRPRRSKWDDADLVFVRESDRGGRFESRGTNARRAAAALEEGVVLEGLLDSIPSLACRVRPTPFKHVGLFPEQAANWEYVRRARERLGERPELLNLFGYTGVASVAAALAGYRVTHVDASKTSVAWCRENAELSGAPADAIRFVCEDALTFASREVRRERRYAGVLLDPPHYGRGPKGQKWTLEEGLAPLLEATDRLLEPGGFCILSTYAVGYSPLAFQNLFEDLGPGRCDVGELALVESHAAADGGERRLPCGFCARYERSLEV
ncbi:Ribosomal RNA large subunit methyltransferase K/L [Planctomycetes bacterium Pla163]|uniref:Ribosomal RNA large subunit methyltransferase K/L n=1 Tax=Rohdeia mirabilis TaxID=2528008 RepID=A0A518CZA9_9BACT|nr:Ribosomal RNA large subunit methyltransferase K/L [Planctomycetes bacterium Pla163]